MQSLLLLHHAIATGIERVSAIRTVALNAPGLSLGELGTVVNETASIRTFSIGVTTRNAAIEWTLGADGWPRDSLAVPVMKIVVNGEQHSVATPGEMPVVPEMVLRNEDARSLVQALFRLRFVPADRLGPAETYPLDDPARHRTPGPRAERTFGNLHWMGSEPLPVSALRHPDGEVPPTIARQVEAWLGELFPGVVLQPSKVTDANLLTLGIRTNKENSFHRPQNVGFGVTYALPLVIAILTAHEGDVVLLENPEAHLHPRAQARLGRLCAKAAAAGVQVVVETHSDHVLNGARVAVHAGIISPDDVSILFFNGPMADEDALVTHIRTDRAGRLDQWPHGFFDEGDHLLDRLLEPIDGEP